MKLKRKGTCILVGVLATSIVALSGCSSTKSSNVSSTVEETTIAEETTENPNALNEKEEIVSEKLKKIFISDKFDPTGYKVFEIADYDSSSKTFVAKIQIKNNYGNTAIRYLVCNFDTNDEYAESQHNYYNYKIGVTEDIDIGKVNRALQDEWRSLGLID